MADINSGGSSGGPGTVPTHGDPARAPRTSAVSDAERDEALIAIVELLFFAYRDFTGEADVKLADLGFGRAHHRVLHFVCRNPGIRVADLLDILRITKQSLARVLKQLIDEAYVEARAGTSDRRERHLYVTRRGEALARELMALQTGRVAAALAQAGPAAEASAEAFLYGMITPAARQRVLELIGGAAVGDEQDYIVRKQCDHVHHIRKRPRRTAAGRCAAHPGGRRRPQDPRPADELSGPARLPHHLGRRHRAGPLGDAGPSFDLVLLDVMLPGQSGLDFARELKTASTIPICMLTARTEPEQRVAGLELGVEDYVAKPFEPRELVLRLRNIMRRGLPASQEPPPDEVRMGAYTFHISRGELKKGEDSIKLTERERDLLRQFAKRSGQPIQRHELAADESTGSERAIDVQINRLRRKIEADPSNPVYLQTVRGKGYILYTD